MLSKIVGAGFLMAAVLSAATGGAPDTRLADAVQKGDRAAVRALLKQAPVESSRKTGYGISNVNERIQLSFGKDYGLRFESAPGKGTVVEILHPLIAGEE